MENEKELTLMPYGNHNGILIYCKNCGSEFEETAEGYYPPIKYESDKHNRECRRCLTELLSKIAKGEINLQELAKRELENRGQNIDGVWVGFKHEIA